MNDVKILSLNGKQMVMLLYNTIKIFQSRLCFLEGLGSFLSSFLSCDFFEFKLCEALLLLWECDLLLEEEVDEDYYYYFYELDEASLFLSCD